MSRVRKGLSYVLGDAGAKENHILPINAMQFSGSRGQLFTGGRDGMVKVWSAASDTPRSQFDFNFGNGVTEEHHQDVAERLLKLETAISSNPLVYKVPDTKYDSGSVRNYNIHFDWINDVKLVDNDRSLVTALADLSLKLINLEGDDSDVHKFQNLHTDYIKKVSPIAPQKLLVSGGLDGKVVVWDLQTLKPVLQFQNYSTTPHLPTSIYALSNNHSNLISTGGPNNTISVYDHRVSSDANANLIRRLVGHQDNVRCLLMNSNYILSGSSDASIKLWDMRNFKVFKNFEVHDDAVWCLSTSLSSAPGSFSDTSNADFTTFYSGDKAGNIIKTDLTHLSTLGDEEEVFPTSCFTSSDISFIDEKVGLCTLVGKADSPIVSLCVEDGKSVFASTYTSLNRYYIPDTEQLSKYQYLRTCADYSNSLANQFDDELGVDGTAAEQSDLNSDFYDIVSHLSMDTGNVDIQSSFSVGNHPGGEVDDEDDSTEYTSMFLCINGGPSLEYVNAYKEELKCASAELECTQIVDETPVEILLNPIPASRIVTIGFNRKPFQEFQVSPKSIIAKRMLNNKRWMLALYLNGDIKLWDVFVCKELKSFPFANNRCPLSSEDLKVRTKDMETIFQEHQTLDTLNNWCEVEIKSGKLLVSLIESSFTNVEIYYDELIRDYPFLAIEHADSYLPKTTRPKPHSDDRFVLSRIFLNSIFHNYSLYEWEHDKKTREELRNYKPKPSAGSITGDGDGSSISSVTEDSSIRKRLFSRKTSGNNPQSRVLMNSPSVSISSNMSQLSEELDDGITDGEIPTVFLEDSILSLLHQNRKIYLDKYGREGTKKVTNSMMKQYADANPPLSKDDEGQYKPLIRASRLPGSLLIIIFENSPDLGNYRDVCSFHLDDLNTLKYPVKNPTKLHLIKQLRQTLPKWIGQPILYDKFPQKEVAKIAFQLFEADYTTLPANKKIGGKVQKKIKRLPALEVSIKLTSQNMLRVNKILHYLTEKFETRTSEMKDKKAPSEWLELECKGQVLHPSMTLQTIKTKIWKSNTDIELRFRRKFDKA